MRLVDLFAGIGGFSLAAHQFGITTDLFVEKEPYPQKILAKNFPDVPIVDDIFNFNAKVYEKLTGHTTTDIISGGFPCQPFSLAGQRKGTEDNRYLWGEMCRVIQELKPRWVIAENVYGLVNIQDGLVFETVHTDLEAQGYDVQAFIIPAAAKNAPHRRDRVWFVAHSNHQRGSTRSREIQKENGEIQKRNDSTQLSNAGTTTNSSTIGCDNGSDNRQERQFCEDKQRNAKEDKPKRRKWELRTSSNSKSDVTNDNSSRIKSQSLKGQKKRQFIRQNRRNIQTPWEEFPTQSPVCGRDDGIPNRVDRIKALGNAIVPQVAMEIFRTIVEVENANVHI